MIKEEINKPIVFHVPFLLINAVMKAPNTPTTNSPLTSSAVPI